MVQQYENRWKFEGICSFKVEKISDVEVLL